MRRLLLVHGFTQTAACWGRLPGMLADVADVVALDAPGHGSAGDERLGLDDGARALGRRGGAGVWLGYSMGGRFALHLALAERERVEGLVLVSTTAGIDDPAEREARWAADEALAAHLEEVRVVAFVDEWLSGPLFAGLDAEARCLGARRTNSVAGLTSSLRLAGTGTQHPLWNRLGQLAMPVLVVAGTADPKFSALAARLVGAIGANATLALVDGAGHTVHLERPDAFVEVVRPWLHQLETATPRASSAP